MIEDYERNWVTIKDGYGGEITIHKDCVKCPYFPKNSNSENGLCTRTTVHKFGGDCHEHRVGGGQ